MCTLSSGKNIFNKTVYYLEKSAISIQGKILGVINDNKGFTLLEISLILVVLGLLLSFVSVAWLSMKNSQQISSAKIVLETVTSCLQDYVIHSRTIPPQGYFTQYCADNDPWGNAVLYYNNGDNQDITAVVSKTLRDGSNDYPDAAFIVVSPGRDKVLSLSSTAALWDCSSGDDLCLSTSKNTLIYEISR